MYQRIPPVTRILLLVNTITFVALLLLGPLSNMIFRTCSLYPVLYSSGGTLHVNPFFMPHQLLTYMFLHANLMHLFFNMFSLWMFGRIIEEVFGSKRFLIFYLICGVGAGLCQEVWQIIGGVPPYAATIGASGACYGILLAFGLTFPNERIMLLIPPIPIKAKWLIIGYVALELYLSVNSNGNIAHIAHVGGMLFGWLCMIAWRMWPRRRYSFTRWDNRVMVDEARPGFFKRTWSKVKGLFRRKPKLQVKGGAAFRDRNADYEYNLRKKQEAASARPDPEQQARIDRILEKVKRSGYDSLTADEKRELFRSSRN